jgi:DNA-binding response OmpR family regulator
VSRKKVLIAEDDPAILDAMKMILEDEGYEVQTTVDGAVIENMSSDLPDVLLLDIWLSGTNGQELCKRLKAQELTRNIPVIMVSANRDGKKIALEAGADDFIAKPFEVEELLSKVEQFL